MNRRMSEAQYDELIDREYEEHVDKLLFPEEEEDYGRENSDN